MSHIPDPMTPAGWYRDPYGDPGLLRWWDGYQWTQATQPLGEGQQASWDWTSAPPTWGPPDPNGPAPGEHGVGFDQGEIAPVMADFQDGRPYVASAYSGAGPATSTPLEMKAKAVLTALEPTAYPGHTRQDVTSASHPVGGHSGWLLKVKPTFPQAKSQGWNFRAETAAIVIVDRGNGLPPAQSYVSIPDSHKRQGDLDLLLRSLKVS